MFNPQADCWLIQCEPHVTIRLKRVFGKIGAKSQGVHHISNTDENAFDLKWFLDRYPMTISEPDFALLRRQSESHVEREGLIHSLLAGRTEPRPFELALPPRHYQSLAATITLETGSLLLADDVGLGKTVTGICLLTDPKTLPAFVCTLTHLPSQWKAEVNRFAPGLSVHVLKKGTPYDLRRQNGKTGPFPDVIIGSYSKLRGWAETLGGLVKSVIFDECQELRRTGSEKYVAAKHIASKANVRLGTSATPIYNYGDEFYSVLDVLAPGCLGTYLEFAREWCTPIGQEKLAIKEPKAFGTYLRERGLMLRRTKTDVGMELPAVSKIPFTVDADLNALNKVSKSCAELARLILKEGETTRGQKWRASEEFNNRLRQATGIAKAPFVADFVRLLIESGEKVVLFGWHREVYSIWLDRLRDLNPVMYTGSESPAKKNMAKESFLSGESPLLIMSLRAGAGLDGLQKVARVAVFGELDWSPGVHEQNIGRIDRDGQQQPVLAYFLIAESGADPIIAEVLGIKRGQSEPVKNPESSLVEQLTIDTDHIKRLAATYLAQLGGGSV
jgi:SNF2 family DNA or RNA helicase